MRKGDYYSYREGACACGCDDLSQCSICGRLVRAWHFDDIDGDHIECANAIAAQEEEDKE